MLTVATSGLAAGAALSTPAAGILLAALAAAVMAVVADRRPSVEWQLVPQSIKPVAASRRTHRRIDSRSDC
jgi:hypothetical protein